MSFLKGVKFFRLTIVILLFLVSLTTIPPKGYCDDWVYSNSWEDFTQYYNSSSIIIDKQDKIIKVWEKRIYTNKGRINLLNNCDRIEIPMYKKISYSLILNLIDYNNRKFTPIWIAHYSEFDQVLFSLKYKPEWNQIITDSIGDNIYTQLIKKYNIQR